MHECGRLTDGNALALIIMTDGLDSPFASKTQSRLRAKSVVLLPDASLVKVGEPLLSSSCSSVAPVPPVACGPKGLVPEAKPPEGKPPEGKPPVACGPKPPVPIGKPPVPEGKLDLENSPDPPLQNSGPPCWLPWGSATGAASAKG